ncbi:uncharacterized protein LOC121861347 [Homarus americanus]|uniref:Putative Complex I intermediate-associated protein 30-like 2 n=1 Tax=Homarus americanus TaxID=6706 RepID=A0A8J5ND63_HOMAM|nr:uncharacterized protein LOC121861347 [Homarus americanus]KAG7177597.1 putative Complex I intermediate-associated protein 30-like 2 [Homarus americanus]
MSGMRVTLLLLVASTGFSMSCLTTAFSTLSSSGTESKMLYDFRTISSLENWQESSDTVRTPGMSKGAFVLQKSQLFQRAVMFSMINPQPNGAGFVGFVNHDKWNLSYFSGIELKVRGQGENYIYKVNFKHKGQGDGSISYEAFYEIPKNEWTVVTLQFNKFKPYFRGVEVPGAEPLDTSDITSTILQIVGGVYSDFKQSGSSSLEIDYIQAVE